MQTSYPELVTNIVERIFTVENPSPKPGFNRIVLDEIGRSGVRLRDLARDAWTGLRGYG